MGLLRGMTPKDILLAVDSGVIIGTLAKWDQREFKQTVVNSYNGKMRAMRHIYNLFAPLFHRSRLVREVEALSFVYAGLLSTVNNNPEIFRSLLDRAHDELTESGFSQLMVGLHERDPLNAVMQDF